MKDVCIILPCAGKGSRLGAAFAKELFPVAYDTNILDNCFQLFRSIAERAVIVVVISEWKMDVVKYLNKYKDEFEIVFIYQKEQYKELLGAVECAKPYYLKYNFIFLPDIWIEWKMFDWENYIATTEESRVAFLVKKEIDFSITKKMGALCIEESRVLNFKDKPTVNDNSYNGYWVSIGFTREIFDTFINDIRRVYSGEYDFNKSCFNNILCLEVQNAIDLGTWENIHKFFQKTAL